ncbi:twin-arginine translocase TatA/TatE family subunit [Paenibacillus sp. strain BS8-2]
MPHFSASTILLLIIAALLLFGPKKLPELGRAVGNTLKEFKKGTREIIVDDESDSSGEREKKILDHKQTEGTDR